MFFSLQRAHSLASSWSPWAGNIAKTMTSNGKQFTVTHEMLTAVARDQSMQLKVAWRCRWNLSTIFKNCFCFYHWFDPFVLLYNKSLNDWSLGEQWILFRSILDVALHFTLLGNKIHCSPWDLSLSVNYHTNPVRKTNRVWVTKCMYN